MITNSAQDQRPVGTTTSRHLAATTALATGLILAASMASSRLPALRPSVDLFLSSATLGAIVAAFLLLNMARILDRPNLRWIAVGNAAAAICMAVQLVGHPAVAPGGGILGTTADGAAWLYLIWHVVVLGTTLAALAGVDRRWQPPVLALTAVVSVVLASNSWIDVPDLFTASLTHNRTMIALAGSVAAATILTLLLWYRQIGDHPLQVEAWITVSLVLLAFDVALNAIADERFTTLWWASLGCRLGQYLVLAGGLLTSVTKLHGDLHSYASRTELRSRASERAAGIDFLTNTLNRRGFTQAARDLTASTYGPAAVLSIDLDDFKQVNDRSGHAAGDLVLRDVGHALTSVSRQNDLVGRWGGDEFVVLLPGTGPNEAERIRERVAGAVCAVAPASVGCVPFTLDGGKSIAAAMVEADEAMYRIKRERHMRTTAADAPPHWVSATTPS